MRSIQQVIDEVTELENIKEIEVKNNGNWSIQQIIEEVIERVIKRNSFLDRRRPPMPVEWPLQPRKCPRTVLGVPGHLKR